MDEERACGGRTLDVTAPLVLTLWRSFARGRREEHTWRSFVDTFVADPEVVRNKKQVAGFSLASFKNDRRALPNVERVYGLVLDFDHGDPSVEKIMRVFKETSGIIYTTWSHEPHAPRFRAAFPLSRAITAAEYDRLWAWTFDACVKEKLEPDIRARDASHLFFLPSHRPGATYKSFEIPGDPIDVERVLKEAGPAPPLRAVPSSGASKPGNTTEGGSQDASPSGLDFRFCLDRLRAGDSDAEIAAALREISKKAALRDDYVERTLEKARLVHEAHAPRMRVTHASFHLLPARFKHSERRHIALELISEDGEIAKTQIIVPSEAYASSAQIWEACFPDIDPSSLLGSWGDVRTAWNAIRWKKRAFEVAVRDGAVRWIRAVDNR